MRPLSKVFTCNALLHLANVGSLKLAVLTGGNVELYSLTLVKSLKTVHLNLGEVNEQIVAVFTRDEAVSLVRIEPLNSTLSHYEPFLF